MTSPQQPTRPRWVPAVLTALMVVAALVLAAGTALAATAPAAEYRIRASSIAAETLDRPPQDVSADQRLETSLPQPEIVVATGVAANTAGKVADDIPRPSVNWGQQEKHFPGHPNFLQGRSTLTADPRVLVERAGTGTPIGNVARGAPGFKERIDFGGVIGQFADQGTGELIPTSVGILHYGSRGVHIVPARPFG